MRIAVASKSHIQIAIIVELFEPVFGKIEVFDQARFDDGSFAMTNAHAVIIDYSDDTIMENDAVLEMLDRDEPKCVLSEKNLYPLPHDERLAWRKKIVDEVLRLLPDLEDEIRLRESKGSGNDIWVIGSSSGGPDALTTFFSALPTLPISIIIAQHIGSDNGSASLQKVLSSRQSNWNIEIAQDGSPVRPGCAYIVQRDTALAIEGDRLSVSEYRLPNLPSPCINATIRALRRSTRKNIGYVILTGLGDDGAAAIKEAKSSAIKVFAQDANDCAARSMPDAARQANVVDESDTAKGIARRIAHHYGVGTI